MKEEIKKSHDSSQNDIKRLDSTVAEVENELKKLEGGVNFVTYDSYNILQSKLNSLKNE